MASNLIDTDKFSDHLRSKAINIPEEKILVTNFTNSEQESDLTVPANCEGFGRIRHFKYSVNENWFTNPLPIFPANRAIGQPNTNMIRAQVFQNAVCNWRCWYCFVDFKLLSGNPKFSSFLSCRELVDMYLDQSDPPEVIDLSGGQPDLTPEWVPWMMKELTSRGLSDKIYLWSDDNLSNDYFWRYLSEEQLDLINGYKNYGRVCCFKGIDEDSFVLNTKATPDLFEQQFKLFDRLLMNLKVDLYCYITLTAQTNTNFSTAIPKLFDRLQSIHENLPLRVVPLEIIEFTPLQGRMGEKEQDAIVGQYKAKDEWMNQLTKRFSASQLKLDITDINLR